MTAIFPTDSRVVVNLSVECLLEALDVFAIYRLVLASVVLVWLWGA